MKIFILVLFFLIALFAMSIVFFLVSVKRRNKNMKKYAEEISEQLEKAGEVKHYEGLATEYLLTLYQEMNAESKTLNTEKDLYRMIEIGCKAELIKGVLINRGIPVPEWR